MNTRNVRARWGGLCALVLVCGSIVSGAEPAAPPAPRTIVAFLGVSVQPVSPPDGKDLGLAEGVGLVVRTVEEQSPAQNRINVGDVLSGLDEQILIHPYQLAVLIRTYKPGTEVRVSLLRGGNEMDIPVVLGEREAGPLSAGAWGQPFGLAAAGGAGMQRPNVPHTIAVNGGTVTINVAGLGDPAAPGGQTATVVAVAAGNDNQRTATAVENGTSYSLSTLNGISTFTVTGPDAKVLFTGPVNTDVEKARVPEAYRARLTSLQVQPAQPGQAPAAPPANAPAPAPAPPPLPPVPAMPPPAAAPPAAAAP